MIMEMDTIQFESKFEIEAVMKVLDKWLDMHPDDKTVEELFNKLDVIHMNW